MNEKKFAGPTPDEYANKMHPGFRDLREKDNPKRPRATNEQKAYRASWVQKDRAKNPEKHAAYMREWTRKNAARYRELGRRHGIRTHVAMRQELLSFWGTECKKCGFNDWRALQLDHIKGRSYDDSPKNRGVRGDNYGRSRSLCAWLNWVRKNTCEAMETYQLLCANCNWIKRYEENELGRKAVGLYDELDSAQESPQASLQFD